MGQLGGSIMYQLASVMTDIFKGIIISLNSSVLNDDIGYIITGRNACGIPVFVYLVSRDG